MAKSSGHDINQWSLQKFRLNSDFFKRIFTYRNKIEGAHLIENQVNNFMLRLVAGKPNASILFKTSE